MKCPICGSENYSYIDTEYDGYTAAIECECNNSKCGKRFYAIYEFTHFEDENCDVISECR